MVNYTELIKEILHYLAILAGTMGSILTLVYGVKKLIDTPLKSYFDEKFKSQKELFMSFISDLKTIAKENCVKIDKIEEIVSRHDVTLQTHSEKIDLLEKKITKHSDCITTINYDIKSLYEKLERDKNGTTK